MTQQINRSFPFKYSQNHSRTGDVIVVGDPYSHTDHLVVPTKMEFDTTRAQAKKTLAVTEATQARAVADTYQDALSLAEQPGNAESVATMARQTLEMIQSQTDQLEAEAVYRTAIQLLEYFGHMPGAPAAIHHGGLPDPESLLCFIGEAADSEELPENRYIWNRYSYQVSWSHRTQRFIGTCAEFPYVKSQADNQAQTIYQVVNMVARCILDLSKQQEPLPEPIGNKG